MFTAALFTIGKIWKQPRCPSVDEWIKKMWFIHTMGYYSAIRRKQILPFAKTQMELEGIMLSEISQAEKDKYQMISFIFGVNNEAKLKEQNSSRLTDSKKGLVVTKGKGCEKAVGKDGEGELWGIMIDAHGVCGVTGKTV